MADPLEPHAISERQQPFLLTRKKNLSFSKKPLDSVFVYRI